MLIILGVFLLSAVLYFFAIFPRLSKKTAMTEFCHTLFAHRGYHCKERRIPENSMKAFQRAVAGGYGIELDVHLTKDERPVVFHDDTLERMCRVGGKISDYTYGELQGFSLLGTGERIPLLSEVLQFVDGRVPLLIELKIPKHDTRICKAAFRELKEYKGAFLIQSFNTVGLFWFKRNAPAVLRGQLSSNLTSVSEDRPYILRFLVKHLMTNFLGRPDFISYRLKDLPSPEVFLCQRLFRIPVAVWTLRTEEALTAGIQKYDIQIFERRGKNY